MEFNQDNYKRTGWKAGISFLKSDELKPRLIIQVATGRKYWPIMSVVITPELGLKDSALSHIRLCVNSYTHPMVQRFVDEIQVMLSDIYSTNIKLSEIELPDSTGKGISNVKFK